MQRIIRESHALQKVACFPALQKTEVFSGNVFENKPVLFECGVVKN